MEKVLPLIALGGVALWIYYYYRKPTVCRGQQRAEEVDEDYISGLPDDVLCSILAKLTVGDAARTTTLSTRWKYVFYIDVERLDISFDQVSYPIKNLRKLIKFSVEILSQACSLKQLFVSDCIVLSSPKVRFNSLTILALQRVVLARGHLECILSSCSNLKQLIIEYSKLPYKLRLASTTVTIVVITNCDGGKEIDLHAAHLHTLDCDYDTNIVKFSFSFVPMLETVILFPRGSTSLSYIFGDFARALPDQVKSLIIRSLSYELKTFPTKMKMFRNLREISLTLLLVDDFDIVKLSPILGACPRLQFLGITVSRNWIIDDQIKGSRRPPILSPTCHTELKLVLFDGFAGTESEIEYVVYILRSAIVLERMFLSPQYNNSSFVWGSTASFSLDQRKRSSIKQKLHGQAISRKAVVTIE